MNLTLSSKYFEILSHPIRYAILVYIDITTKNYSEIMDGLSSEIEIRSNKLNFHLKKMLDEGILIKKGKAYSVSEQGLKLLSLMYQFDNLEPNKDIKNTTDSEEKIEPVQETVTTFKKGALPIIRKIEAVPPLVSIFEYFEGKNYDYMEEKYELALPDPISTSDKPKKWISKFTKQLESLLQNSTSKEWLIDRFLKLGYGTRGLQDFGLMDASISVPPTESLFNTIVEVLSTRGKVGLHGKTGMGKSRIGLYIASYWIRTYKTPVFYIQYPYYLQDSDFDKLQQFLLAKAGNSRKTSRYLVIIEDAHLLDEKSIESVKRFISGASNKTYAIFATFTEIEVMNDTYKTEKANIEEIEQLKQELIPNEYVEELYLTNHWRTVRPYFSEWIRWVAIDVLFDLIPMYDKENKNSIDLYNSPWSFVVSLGFLKGAIKKLENSATTNSFPLALYYCLAQIYIMRSEKSISIKSLKELLDTYLSNELQDTFGLLWEEKLIKQLNEWTHPSSRLLPPYKYIQKQINLSKDAYINFYHIEWANEVCSYLDTSSIENKLFYDKILSSVLPLLYSLWKQLLEKDEEPSANFALWLRENVRFDINLKGEIMLTRLSLEQSQKKVLVDFKIEEENIKNLNQSEFVNWMFMKSVINS